MPLGFWTTITQLGNSTLLQPAALALALWLLATGQLRLPAAWLLSFGTAVALVLASKLAFMGWGLGIAAIDFTGLSGHSTVSTAVFTMGAWLAVADRSPRARQLAVAAGLLVGVLVSISRLALHAHSVSEVVTGFALGAMAALLPIAWRSGAPRIRQRWVPVALACTLALVPQMGRPAETHGLVQQMALAVSGRTQVYSRHMLHADAL
ncbi:phosphatase PAP2 family protein [Pseudorhodoferax sp. Leaf267]|uniref:phosphatase PAP2 family protein n=1 Tax=Pseudorhodoferax sp. Leaf267 TaxID=1736316 RepID=UPI0006FDC8EC|nr:phosphatase PAP2 family protein [Pseudorhodoferax sp. Leaf267]KQP21505.1 hypothetical protein ASF43_26425 [Pseudorhodoferax sp. Leaf267]